MTYRTEGEGRLHIVSKHMNAAPTNAGRFEKTAENKSSGKEFDDKEAEWRRKIMEHDKNKKKRQEEEEADRRRKYEEAKV